MEREDKWKQLKTKNQRVFIWLDCFLRLVCTKQNPRVFQTPIPSVGCLDTCGGFPDPKPPFRERSLVEICCDGIHLIFLLTRVSTVSPLNLWAFWGRKSGVTESHLLPFQSKDLFLKALAGHCSPWTQKSKSSPATQWQMSSALDDKVVNIKRYQAFKEQNMRWHLQHLRRKRSCSQETYLKIH